jgi:excisionase family DNA binding protein
MSTTTPTVDRMVTLKTAVDLTGLGYSTLRAKIASGKLPAYRVDGGHALRVKESDLTALFVKVTGKD